MEDYFDWPLVYDGDLVSPPKTIIQGETCGSLFYCGLGEERLCGKPAACILDEGKPYEDFRCDDCAKQCHPGRLSVIAPERARGE